MCIVLIGDNSKIGTVGLKRNKSTPQPRLGKQLSIVGAALEDIQRTSQLLDRRSHGGVGGGGVLALGNSASHQPISGNSLITSPDNLNLNFVHSAHFHGGGGSSNANYTHTHTHLPNHHGGQGGQGGGVGVGGGGGGYHTHNSSVVSNQSNRGINNIKYMQNI